MEQNLEEVIVSEVMDDAGGEANPSEEGQGGGKAEPSSGELAQLRQELNMLRRENESLRQMMTALAKQGGQGQDESSGEEEDPARAAIREELEELQREERLAQVETAVRHELDRKRQELGLSDVEMAEFIRVASGIAADLAEKVAKRGMPASPEEIREAMDDAGLVYKIYKQVKRHKKQGALPSSQTGQTPQSGPEEVIGLDEEGRFILTDEKRLIQDLKGQKEEDFVL